MIPNEGSNTPNRQHGTFLRRERERVFQLRHQIFSEKACASLLADRWHLGSGYESENLFSGFREQAHEFFEHREIKWHGNGGCDASIVSSQVACLNCFFGFTLDPTALFLFLAALFGDVAEVLPIDAALEPSLPNGDQPFTTFEWIGETNYLKERGNSRGSFRTNVDAVFRYRATDGRVRLVLTEWKYCESYPTVRYYQTSKNGTDRVAHYSRELELTNCQLALPDSIPFRNLFFDPFDQLMRLQLLASAMERAKEMAADCVSVLHVSPRSNGELLNEELVRNIAQNGECSVAGVWGKFTTSGRFLCIALEELIPLVVASSPGSEWAKYISLRYGDIRWSTQRRRRPAKKYTLNRLDLILLRTRK